MRQFFLIFAFSISFAASAQTELNARIKFGLNRIGIISELGLEYKMDRHAVDLGIRLYEPDLVFEKDLPGIQLGYLFDFAEVENTVLKAGVGLGLYYESRATTNLLLFNPSIRMRSETKLGDLFSLNFEIGVGPAINRVKIIPTKKMERYTYMNYEITVGIIYRLWRATGS